MNIAKDLIKENELREINDYTRPMDSTCVDSLNSQSKFEEMPQSFRDILASTSKSRQQEEDLPYIVGYKGFRRGVTSGNYYGKNFIDTSLAAKREYMNK